MNFVEGKLCCVCGEPAAGCYGKVVKGNVLYVYVCRDHCLTSDQKYSLLQLRVNHRSDSEISAILLGAVRCFFTNQKARAM